MSVWMPCGKTRTCGDCAAGPACVQSSCQPPLHAARLPVSPSPQPLPGLLSPGKVEKREHLLDEKDPLYVELRHKHFAAASIHISSLMDEFRTKNRVAKQRGASSGNVGDMGLRDMSKLLQNLPQYRCVRCACGGGSRACRGAMGVPSGMHGGSHS